MSGKYDALFQPIQIGGVTLKNRIVHCAMGGTAPFGHGAYHYEEDIADYYRGLADGGVGLIVPGVTQIKVGDHYLCECEDIFRGPIKDLMDMLHEKGTKFFLQIGAGFGRVQLSGLQNLDALDEADKNTLIVAPSDGLPNVWYPDLKHRGLREEEIHAIVEAFGKTAALCKEAGIDGIEIHAVHEGYLLDQFAVKNTNYRTDAYGGSLENRLRFACEIIQEIHRVNGDDYPVSVRYSVASKMRGFNAGAVPGEDYLEFGRSMEESPKAARILEAAGANMLNADNGSYDSWWWAHPPVYMPLHCNFPEVSYIKNFVDIPVFCAGRMEDPEFSTAEVAKGTIDGIGVARQFLADPAWVNKVQEERLEDIRPCIACHNGCFALGGIPANDGRDFLMGHCALRPASRAEEKWKLVPAEEKKKVAVIGGGVGGMEAARILTLRGHDVVVYEKTDVLGGVFIAAAAPSFKEKDRMLIDWYRHEMERLNIDIRLNTEATPEMLEDFDTVIAATGSHPRQLPVAGIDNPAVMQAVEFLLGEKQVGEKVVIVGGGLTGVEIAYQLALEGRKPAIVEMLPDILQVPGLCAANANLLRELIRYHEIEVHTGAALAAVEAASADTASAGVNVKIRVDGKEETLAADSVILSVGYISDHQLADQLKAAGKQEVYVIGDAERVSNLMSAIYGAYRVAYKI